MICALCRTPARAPLPAALQAALMSCCHLWIPAVSDPICEEHQKFYRLHIREHDGSVKKAPVLKLKKVDLIRLTAALAENATPHA